MKRERMWGKMPQINNKVQIRIKTEWYDLTSKCQSKKVPR